MFGTWGHISSVIRFLGEIGVILPIGIVCITVWGIRLWLVLAHQRGGIFAISKDMETKARISTLARKVEELEGKRLHEVQAVTEKIPTLGSFSHIIQKIHGFIWMLAQEVPSTHCF